MPGFRLTDDEAWQAIADAHTSLLTTLRADGRPITLPTWHVVIDRTILLRTPTRAKKLARIRNDDRGHFVIERGRDWADLAAVTLEVRCEIVEDEELAARARDAVDQKYAAHAAPLERLPEAVQRTYGDMRVVRLVPAGRLHSWNNRALLGDDTAIEWGR